MTLADLIAEVDRHAVEAERRAAKDGRGSKAELLAATYRSARKALRVADELEKPGAGATGGETGT